MIELNKEYTYSDICNELGWTETGGDAKKAQIKEIERCFEFFHPINRKTKKTKKSYIFTAIIKEAEQPSRRNNGGAHNNKNISIMIDYILHYLIADTSERTMTYLLCDSSISLLRKDILNMIYRDDSLKEYCATQGINEEFIRFYISQTRKILKDLLLKALNKMMNDNLLKVKTGYIIYYSNGDMHKNGLNYLRYDDVDNDFTKIETEVCDQLNDKYFLSEKMQGRQLLKLIYQNEKYRKKYDSERYKRIINDKDLIDKINKNNKYNITDEHNIVAYYPTIKLTDCKNNQHDNNIECRNAIINLIVNKVRQAVLNEKIYGDNRFEGAYIFDNTLKIEKELYKYNVSIADKISYEKTLINRVDSFIPEEINYIDDDDYDYIFDRSRFDMNGMEDLESASGF